MTSYIHIGIKVADGSKYFQSFTLQVKVTYNPEFKIIQKNQRVRRPTVRPQKRPRNGQQEHLHHGWRIT
jgi:hypothetical protein